MLTLSSPHYLSLILALAFSFLVHFSFTGYTNKLETFLISFALFPVLLMGLSLFVPQNILQFSSYLLVFVGLVLAIYKTPKRVENTIHFYKSIESRERWIIFAVCIYLLSFYMNTTIFRDGGTLQDAMVYHLEGPKEWALYLSGAKFNPNNPTTFTTSYYDYYYYFLFLLAKPLFIFSAPLASTQYEFFCYTMLLTAQTFCI